MGSDTSSATLVHRPGGAPVPGWVVEGIIWRCRVGAPWQDVPRDFGPWQTLWKRHRRYCGDGTWDILHAALLADADATGLIDWTVSVDSTVDRAHQHATNLPRVAGDTGGPVGMVTTT